MMRHPPPIGNVLIGGLALIGVLFLTLPLVALLVRSLQNQAWEGLQSSLILSAIDISAHSTLRAMMITVGLGIPLAYVLSRWQFRFKRLLTVLVELPIVLPPAVAGLALLLTFGRRGFFGPVLDEVGISLSFSFAAVVMAQTFVAAPFFIRAAQVGFSSIPKEIEDAARVDGAGGWSLFLFITMPLSARALSAGLVMAWARALGEFGATILFAGSLQGRTQTMPLLIYNALERDVNAAIAVGLILVGLALAALLVARWLEVGEQAA